MDRRKYNGSHIKTRDVTERAFGVLNITADMLCTVLHNIAAITEKKKKKLNL